MLKKGKPEAEVTVFKKNQKISKNDQNFKTRIPNAPLHALVQCLSVFEQASRGWTEEETISFPGPLPMSQGRGPGNEVEEERLWDWCYKIAFEGPRCSLQRTWTK